MIYCTAADLLCFNKIGALLMHAKMNDQKFDLLKLTRGVISLSFIF